MNNPAQKFMEPPRASGLAAILRAWRLLLIGFLAGGLLGAAAYGLFPPAYRASAVVVLNQNLEKSYPLSPDREVFYFLERETNKLEELAWSDDVLQRVVDELRDISMVELRSGALQLSQPADGGWRFYGIAADPVRAKQLANSWANAFEKEVSLAVSAGQELETVQKEMTSLTENTQNDVSTGEISDLQKKIDALNFRVKGINPLAQVYRSQEKGMLVERVSSQGQYVLVGALTGLVIMIIAGAFFQRGEPDEA